MATDYAKKTFDNINAASFFLKYLPHIRNVKHKMRGTNGNGKPIDFSEEEKKEISKAILQMCKDVRAK